MASPIIGVLGFIILVVLIVLGVRLAIALLLTGIIGIIMIIGLQPALDLLGSGMYVSSSVYIFTCLPLFLLMGIIASVGGFAETAYEALRNWLWRLPGSLAICTCFGSAIFGALTGSSTATVAIFGKISYPLMVKYGYQKGLSLGSIAAAGTFSTMIPPTGLLIIYGIFTEQSIGQLFMAGIVPGMCTALVYSLSIVIRVWRNPKLAPIKEESTLSFRDKGVLTLRMWPTIVVVTIVLGGIYLGVFTVTEAAAAGSLVAFLLACQQRGFKAIRIGSILMETAKMTAMILLIVVGALIFTRFVALSQLAVVFAEFLQETGMPKVAVFALIALMYFFLGMFINALGMITITIPVIFPLIVSMGHDPIWFAIVVVKLCEIGYVTPPVGINVYILKGIVGSDATLAECFAGIWPFVICDFAVLALLFLFPQIALFLPGAMYG